MAEESDGYTGGGTVTWETEFGSITMAQSQIYADPGNFACDGDGDGVNEVMPSRAEYDELKEEIIAIKKQVILIDRDNCLEADYKELKEAYEAYEALAKKLRTFKALKDSA